MIDHKNKYYFHTLTKSEQKKYIERCRKFVAYARDLFHELYGFDIFTDKKTENYDRRMILLICIKSVIKIQKPIQEVSTSKRWIEYLIQRYDKLIKHEIAKIRKAIETQEKVILNQLEFLGFFDYFDKIKPDSILEPCNIAERIVKVHGIEMAKEIAKEIIKI